MKYLKKRLKALKEVVDSFPLKRVWYLNELKREINKILSKRLMITEKQLGMIIPLDRKFRKYKSSNLKGEGRSYIFVPMKATRR